MNLTLSWDLFIIVFFVVITTYTTIIGKKESMKVIIATYVAIVAAQGIGNVLQRIMSTAPQSALNMLGLTGNLPFLSIMKLVLFIVIIVLLTIRGGVQLQYEKETMLVNFFITVLCGLATAGLLLCALLTYVSNIPLLDMGMPKLASLSPIIQQSHLMQIMVLNQDLWFSFPAIVLIGAGFAGKSQKL